MLVSHEGGAHIVIDLVPFLKCFRLTGATGGHDDTDGWVFLVMVAGNILQGVEEDRLLVNALESGEHVHAVERIQEAGYGHLAHIIESVSTEIQFISRNLGNRFQATCLLLLGDAAKTLALDSARIVMVKVTVYLFIAKVTVLDIPVNKVLLGLREGKVGWWF